ncbi:MAG: Biopolymer transport protein ExbD [Deltaproteobacteria bacterium ADurb.Bin151]|jgi:biopolymer transport protein TolR|nr:protein TolR [Smithella sp.]OQB56358.1 MAG: Biopolymer transport protein ExbD [Deltaproteobacteria bacterium ADurb.Bin151]HNZ09940.1 protein TolR [Smithellaceae bacterium]HOG81409.1 protein TolR [Smithellaceae bacterium]HOQ42181.1 protein TolR [Smithellaceae bacterium]
MRHSRRRNSENKSMADINVTPLVDVMLVLLIIFMVTAPMLSMGIDVNLPRVKSKTVDLAEEKLILSINENKEIFLNKTRMSLQDLNTKLAAIFEQRVDREIFLRADKNVSYGFVVEVMSEIRKAGVDKLGMITEPPEDMK